MRGNMTTTGWLQSLEVKRGHVGVSVSGDLDDVILATAWSNSILKECWLCSISQWLHRSQSIVLPLLYKPVAAQVTENSAGSAL
jgi:hypothetical protein